MSNVASNFDGRTLNDSTEYRYYNGEKRGFEKVVFLYDGGDE